MFCVKFCCGLGSILTLLAMEATAIPTEPQPLRYFNHIVTQSLFIWRRVSAPKKKQLKIFVVQNEFYHLRIFLVTGCDFVIVVVVWREDE